MRRLLGIGGLVLLVACASDGINTSSFAPPQRFGALTVVRCLYKGSMPVTVDQLAQVYESEYGCVMTLPVAGSWTVDASPTNPAAVVAAAVADVPKHPEFKDGDTVILYGTSYQVLACAPGNVVKVNARLAAMNAAIEKVRVTENQSAVRDCTLVRNANLEHASPYAQRWTAVSDGGDTLYVPRGPDGPARAAVYRCH
ncbi:MAG TPA: hypothetical protein VMH79_14410 [Thermoanaerobaculia bacterium]|nr:hypothetical protein [Thermoanaerobaculia bacterium]